MSSFNPFTNRRKKQEEKLQEATSQRYGDQSLAAYEQSQQLASDVSPPTPLFGAAPTLPKSADGAYDVANLDRFLPDSAKTDQPAVLRSRSSYEPPSRGRQCLAKVQSGFMIGAALGGAFGFAYGSFAAIKYRHVLYLPIAVMQAGGAFGFFLACGTVIRCEELSEYKERGM